MMHGPLNIRVFIIMYLSHLLFHNLPLKQTEETRSEILPGTDIISISYITISDSSSSLAAHASQIFIKVPQPATVHLAHDT